MEVSEIGLAFIEHEEGCIDHVYRDQKGLYTVGVGHLVRPGEHFAPHLSQQDIRDLLHGDLTRFHDAVEAANGDLEQHQFDACVSLAFNIGVAGFASSTLAKHLAAGDMDAAAAEFPKWTSGRIPVLVARRAREQKLFETGDYGNVQAA